jgi:hypothetical protein
MTSSGGVMPDIDLSDTAPLRDREDRREAWRSS